MLGKLIGESAGQTTGTRVLSTEGADTKVEVSFQGRGKLLDRGITDLGTYWQIVRPGGVLYGEGKVLMMTDDGEMAPWTGFGVGRPTGPAPAATYGVGGSFQTTSPALAQLNGIMTAIEYVVNADGTYRWQCWEWTGPAPS